MWFHLLLPAAFSTVFVFRFLQSPLQFVLLVLGLYLGFCLILIDRLLHALYVEPDTEFSKKIQHAWKSKQYLQLFTLIWREGPFEQANLISRSTIFMLCYMALAIYVVTSSNTVFGIGFVLGIGLHYCLDLVLYHTQPDFFAEQFLWQIKRKFKSSEVKWLVAGFLFYFVMLTILTLR
ncbi:hypothetical protein BH10PAT2_BH10PAT2_2390 [soil metagenome]